MFWQLFHDEKEEWNMQPRFFLILLPETHLSSSSPMMIQSSSLVSFADYKTV